MHKTKSNQLEAKRQALEAECQNMKPIDTGKIMLEIALAQLETLIAMLEKIEANCRS